MRAFTAPAASAPAGRVQVNDVIGMAGRGARNKIVFDFDDPMGESTCVACGECVQACPTGALMPAKEVGKETPAEKVESVCPYCGVGCQLTFNVKDNKILWVDGKDGPANHGRLCVKGRFGFDYVSHPHRLTTPLIRREDAPKSPDIDIDPANLLTHFREASWEEALDRAAAGLKHIRDRHGPSALAGFGSAKGSNEEAYLFQKLVRAGFGTNNVDHCTRLCHASSVAALLECIGSGAVTASFNQVEHSDVIIVIGAQPTANHPVAATFFKNAAKRGANLIVIDPRGSALARHASHFLQFKSGTDVALLNALMHVIVEEELYDRQYVSAHTEGFEQLKAHLAGYTPEEMGPVCSIEPDVLREVARLYGRAEAAIIFWGMGISQHIHGTDNARCLISLALIAGQVGRPGTGLHPLRGQNNVQGASDAGLIPMMYPDYQQVTDPDRREKFSEFWGAELDPNAGLTVVEVMNAAHEGAVKGMYIMGENPAMSDPNLHHVREALASLDHLVVQELFLTETACYADVVLPASAWPEKDGTVTNTNRQVQMGRTALAMPDGARQDWWIIQEIARRIGLNWTYGGPADVFAEMAGCMPSLDNISWERASPRERRRLSLQRRGRARPRRHLRGRLPDPEQAGQARAGGHRAAGRIARRRVPPGVDDRPHAGALAYRRDDPPRLRARRSRTGSRRPSRAGRAGTHADRAGHADHGRDPAGRHRAARPRRCRRSRRRRLRSVLLRRGRRQHADQPGPRPVRQDSGVQVLRRPGHSG